MEVERPERKISLDKNENEGLYNYGFNESWHLWANYHDQEMERQREEFVNKLEEICGTRDQGDMTIYAPLRELINQYKVK